MSAPHRAGVVAILGRPNAGKSTLLNRLLGEKLAIVTAKPQTTRSRILGILTRADAQVLFLDTPGLHRSEKVLNTELNAQVREAAGDCDVALLLIDLTRGLAREDEELLSILSARSVPVIAVGTKLDLAAARDAPWPPREATEATRVSAATGEGVTELIDALVAHLPAAPPYYPEGDLSDRPLRFLAAELIREAAFEELSQELPYACAVEVISFDEKRSDGIRIEANLLVERESQKPIVIGQGGSMIKRIGIRARREIEQLVGGRAHLALRVKVERNWSKRPERIRALGYR